MKFPNFFYTIILVIMFLFDFNFNTIAYVAISYVFLLEVMLYIKNKLIKQDDEIIKIYKETCSEYTQLFKTYDKIYKDCIELYKESSHSSQIAWSIVDMLHKAKIDFPDELDEMEFISYLDYIQYKYSNKE